MVRILHVVTYMGRGGLETMLMNYYRHMDREKIQFDFLVHRDFEADYDAEILALGGKIYRMPRLIPWSRSYKAGLRSFFAAHPEHKTVHVHQDCLSSVALQCAAESGVPTRIAHSHTSNQGKNLKYLIKRYYMKKIPRYATDFFACSAEAGSWMFGNVDFEVLHNAIDVPAYVYAQAVAARVRRTLGIGDELLIGHVGRFRDEKTNLYLLDFFSALLQREPAAKLLLVGDGDCMAAARDKAATLGIQDRVIFAGSRADVPELMQAMDVFVLPSLFEGLPLTLIEAQAAGLPCVISDAVPLECALTDGLVTVKKLSDTPSDWAAHILERRSVPRCPHTEELRAAGYDITEAAGKLLAFYLDKG